MVTKVLGLEVVPILQLGMQSKFTIKRVVICMVLDSPTNLGVCTCRDNTFHVDEAEEKCPSSSSNNT